MTAPLFLTETELRDLTGRKLKSRQVEALAKMGVPYLLNAAGRPVVCAAVNSAMNQYGEEVLLKIAKMMLQKRRLEEKQKNAERADLQSDTSNDLPL